MCKIEWWERTNRPIFQELKANEWERLDGRILTVERGPEAGREIDINREFLHSEWRKTPTSEKRIIILDEDKPKMSRPLAQTAFRYLDFRIKVSSAPGCDCELNYKQETATQIIDFFGGGREPFVFLYVPNPTEPPTTRRRK